MSKNYPGEDLQAVLMKELNLGYTMNMTEALQGWTGQRQRNCLRVLNMTKLFA